MSILAKCDSFIEENHAYKLQSHAQQSSRVSQPGRPSQDMMSFWGKRDSFSVLQYYLDILRLRNYHGKPE